MPRGWRLFGPTSTIEQFYVKVCVDAFAARYDEQLRSEDPKLRVHARKVQPAAAVIRMPGPALAYVFQARTMPVRCGW